MWKPRAKYGNKKTEYKGRKYDSKREATHAAILDLRIKAKEVKEVVPQFKISLDVNGHHICNYFIDFKVTLIDGSVEYHEVKGFETDVWKIKWKLTKALYGKGKAKWLIIK